MTLITVPLTSFLKQLTQLVVEIFYPSSCLHCSDAVEHSDYQFLCSACSRELFLSKPPSCSTCGYPFFWTACGPARLSALHRVGSSLCAGKNSLSSERPRPFNYPRIKIPIWVLCAEGCKGDDCKNSLL